MENYELSKNAYIKALGWIPVAKEVIVFRNNILNNLGLCYFNLENHDSSLNYAELCLSKNINPFFNYKLKAESLYRLKKYKKCIEAISVGDTLIDDKAQYLRLKINCEEALEMRDSVLKDRIILLDYEPQNDSIAQIIYKDAVKYKMESKAKKQITDLINRKPNEALYYWVRSLFYQNNYQKYIKNYDMVIALSVHKDRPYKLYSEYLFNKSHGNIPDSERKGRKLKANKALKESLKLDPYYYYTYEYLVRGNMWGNRKDANKYKELGLERFKEKFKNNSSNQKYAIVIAKLYDLSTNGYDNPRKHKDSSLRYYQIALDNGADSLYIFRKRFTTFSDVGKYQQCLNDLLSMVKNEYYFINRETTLWWLSNTYAKLGRNQKAYDLMSLLLKEDPNNRNTKSRMRDFRKKHKGKIII